MARSSKHSATPITVPLVLSSTEKMRSKTANVSIIDRAKGAPYFMLTVSMPFSMEEIKKLTGEQTITSMVQWLQEQALPLEEMLADGAARDQMLEYLQEYARMDRESGRLPNPRRASKRGR